MAIFVAAQVLLAIVVPSRGEPRQADFDTFGPSERGSSSDVFDGDEGFEIDPVTGARVAVPGRGARAGGATSTGGANQAGETTDAVAGRVTDDKSKCAPGGVLQQNVTRISPRCVGKWVGDNGGATHRGVTREEIKIVYVRVPVPEFIEPVFVRGGLAATKEEEEHHLKAWERFFNKHYEYYGRRLNFVLHVMSCESNDPNIVGCYRQEARNIVEEYQPFAVYQFGGGGYPEWHDELARLGVLTIGGQHLPASFSQSRRPYHYDLFASGDDVAVNIADYWCKRMIGKLAARAGDPTFRGQTRKLGLISESTPGSFGTWPHVTRMFTQLVTGGRCGGSADMPAIFDVQNDPAQTANQMNAAATAFKREGITTVICFCYLLTPTFMTSAFDEQQYFPEHLMHGGAAIDVDVVGRLYTQSQWKNAFGPSFFPLLTDIPSSDQGRAWRDAGEEGDPCLVCGSIWLFQEPLAIMMQWAGPHPTPASVERGTVSAPPIAGWEATGGDPTVPMWKFGPGDYNGYQDVKEVYWDPSARSNIDGQPGAYVPTHGGRRYEIATWPGGDPLT